MFKFGRPATGSRTFHEHLARAHTQAGLAMALACGGPWERGWRAASPPQTRWPRFSGRVSKTTPPGCSRPGSLHPHSSSETRQGSTPKPREVPVTHTGRGRGVRAASPRRHPPGRRPVSFPRPQLCWDLVTGTVFAEQRRTTGQGPCAVTRGFILHQSC